MCKPVINKYKYSSGQSLTELLVLMLLLVPLFLLIPVLGQYTHIKQRTIEASRGAAWEMTVFKDHIYDPAQQAALQDKVVSRYFNSAKAKIESTPPGAWSQPDPLFKTLYGQTLVTYNDAQLVSLTEQGLRDYGATLLFGITVPL